MDMPAEGTVLEEEGTGLKFVILDGKLSYIENAGLFAGSPQMINTPDLEELRNNGGEAISSDAYLAIAEGKGYLVNNGAKRYFTSEDAIQKYHFNRANFLEKATGDLPENTGSDLA